jgi:hypothetical protein
LQTHTSHICLQWLEYAGEAGHMIRCELDAQSDAVS